MAAYTQAQLDALRAAAASGTLTVSSEGSSVTYRSLEELLQQIGLIERALEGDDPAATPRVRCFRFSTSKGIAA